jgi:predicted RNase H-like HicB family nuclease
MALHFTVVLVPQKRGGWCAHFPDVPGCRAMGDNIESAIVNSYREIIAKLERMINMPTPLSETEIRADRAWAYARGINWSITQTRQVQIAADDYAI